MRHLTLVAFTISIALVAACTEAPPPTLTPAPEGTAVGSTMQEIQVQPPSGGTVVMPPAVVPPVKIDQVATYSDAEGAFSMDLPIGWPESRQQVDPNSDVKVGTFFQPMERNGLISVTHFDSGQKPESIGVTINQVLEMSGVFDQPNFLELRREKVYEREGDAMRVEMVYTRESDGVDMHSLVLFQIDGTTFSMVNVGVESDSWLDNEAVIRDMLGSYRVPASGGG